jgi:hypothetical protein
VLSCRPSSSHQDLGIVSWRTEGFVKGEERAIEFIRTNLIPKRKGP